MSCVVCAGTKPVANITGSLLAMAAEDFLNEASEDLLLCKFFFLCQRQSILSLMGRHKIRHPTACFLVYPMARYHSAFSYTMIAIIPSTPSPGC